MKNLKHNFLFPIWGEKYIANFNIFALNCLLNNFRLIRKRQLDKISISIFTLNKDIKHFKNLKNIKLLNKLVNIKYTPIDYLFKEWRHISSKYLFLANLQSLFLSVSSIHKYDYAWFIYPDFIFNNDLILNIINKINRNNYEAVFLPVPQIVEEEVKKILINNNINKIILDLKIILQDHIHPIVSNCDIDNLKTNTPSMFMTSKKDEFILFRYFHIHPLVVKLNLNGDYIFHEMNYSLDQDLFKNMQNRNFHVVNNDKVAICVSLLKLYEINLLNEKFNLKRTCSWIIDNTHLPHFDYVKKNYLVKYKNFNLESFNKKKFQLEQHILKINKELNKKTTSNELQFCRSLELQQFNNNKILFLKREFHRYINFNYKKKNYNIKNILNSFLKKNNKIIELKYFKELYK